MNLVSARSAGLLALLLLTAAGCGGSSAESLIKQQIKLMNEMADAVEGGASTDQMDGIKERMEAVGERLKKLEPGMDEMKRLQDKYAGELQKAMGRMMTASMSRMSKEMGKAVLGGLPNMPNLPIPSSSP